MRQNPSGVAPTSLAIRTGRVDCLRILCEKGARLDQPDASGMTPAILAFKRKSLPCMEVLVEYGALVEEVAVTTRGGLFDLVLTTNASFEGNHSMELEGLKLNKVSKLLKTKGVRQVASVTGISPIHQAIEQNDIKLLEKALQVGLSSNTADSSGVMPLFVLKPTNDLQMLELLLENGAKPHKWWEDWHGLSNDGSSLIVTLAVKEKRLDLLEKLLANSRDAFRDKDSRGVSHKIVGHVSSSI